MNDRELLDRVHAARENPPRHYDDMIQDTLHKLKRGQAVRRKKAPRPKTIRVAAAMLAGLTLIVAFGPTIVKAASDWLSTLFAQDVQKDQAEMARPTDERVAELVDAYTANGYDQSYDDITAQVGDMTAKLSSAGFITDDENGGYDFRATLEFTPILEDFDPGWIDFKLIIDGKEYLEDEEYTQWYRDMYPISKDSLRAEWQAIHGKVNVTPRFVHEDIIPLDVMDMEIVATLHTVDENGVKKEDIGEMRLPFTLDRQVALAQTEEEAQEILPDIDRINQERAEEYQKIAEAAVPVGVSCDVREGEVILREMSMKDGEIYFTFQVMGDVGDMMEKPEWLMANIQIGPYRSRMSGTADNLDIEEGQGFVHWNKPNQNPANLKGEMLMRIGIGSWDEEAALVYRYNWDTGEVKIPADEAETAAWMQEAEDILIDEEEIYEKYEFDISEKFGDITVNIEEVDLLSTCIYVGFPLEKDKIFNIERPIDATIDGMKAEAYDGAVNADRAHVRIDFPVHSGELPSIIPVVIDYTMEFADGTSEDIHIEFELDRSKALPLFKDR